MQNSHTQVGTSAGLVRGVESDGLLVWRGVPFAAPPVGDRRHRPPAPLESWSGVRETVEVPAIAWQSPPPATMPAPLGTPPPPPPDEDCLYLSITRPDGPLPPEGLPVLVWIHGGGYATGSSALDTDGVALARHGLVVVSVAYRLGAFGFLHLGDLLGQPFAGSGAAGLADQLHALRWVRDNISAFGGDPRQVTLYGISRVRKASRTSCRTPVLAAWCIGPSPPAGAANTSPPSNRPARSPPASWPRWDCAPTPPTG